jgi:hypothetical protein
MLSPASRSQPVPKFGLAMDREEGGSLLGPHRELPIGTSSHTGRRAIALQALW